MKHVTVHPPELTKPRDLFVAMLQVGTVQGRPAFEPLAYGITGQPSPEMLLRRGARATGFNSEEQAWAHLDKSAALWKAAGLTFHHRKQVTVLKVEDFAS